MLINSHSISPPKNISKWPSVGLASRRPTNLALLLMGTGTVMVVVMLMIATFLMLTFTDHQEPAGIVYTPRSLLLDLATKAPITKTKTAFTDPRVILENKSSRERLQQQQLRTWNPKSFATASVTVKLESISSSGSSDNRAATVSPTVAPTSMSAATQHLSFKKMRQYYQCKDYFKSAERPTNHTAIWNAMYQLYENHIPTSNAVLQETKRHLRYTNSTWSRLPSQGALQVPYKVDFIGHKGLGLIATANITKGRRVFDGRLEHNRGRIRFDHGNDFRKYLEVLMKMDHHNNDNDNHDGDRGDRKSNKKNDGKLYYKGMLHCLAMQCAAVESTWYPDVSKDDYDSEDYDKFEKNSFIVVDLNDACFANDGVTSEEENVGSLSASNSTQSDDCKKQCDFALRDITAGEELAWDYGEYIMGGWSKFGL